MLAFLKNNLLTPSPPTPKPVSKSRANGLNSSMASLKKRAENGHSSRFTPTASSAKTKQTTMSRFLNSSKENDETRDVDGMFDKSIEIKLEQESKVVVKMLRELTTNVAHVETEPDKGLQPMISIPSQDIRDGNFPAIKEEKTGPVIEIDVRMASEVPSNRSDETASSNKSVDIRRSRRLSICVELFSSPVVQARNSEKKKEKKTKTQPAIVAKQSEAVEVRPEVPKLAPAPREETSFHIKRSRRQSVGMERLNAAASPAHKEIDKFRSLSEDKTSSNRKPVEDLDFVKQSVDKEAAEKSDKAQVVAKAKKRQRETLQEPVRGAKRRKLNSGSPAVENDIIEEVIEDIWHVSLMSVNHELVARFLVKWDGFAPSENTYEPYEHVAHAEVLKDYVRRKYEIHQDKIDAEIAKLMAETNDLFETFLLKTKTKNIKNLAKFDELRFKCNVLAKIYTYKNTSRCSAFMVRLRRQTVLFRFNQLLQQEKTSHDAMAKKFMKKEENVFQITVENLIDYEAVPSFKYLRKVEHPDKVLSKVGCNCTSLCNKSSICCPNSKNVEFVYDVDERICALSHQMIVECNKFCSCDESCPNRPKKTKISLCIFKTSDRGWALKTLETIRPGAFVIEYTGELIDQSEALTRSQVYNKMGITYLFDLDYNEESEATYSIDATKKGNLSRFINHSCNANLQTWPATSCNENPKMHRLYYFSLRQIKAGEELTVDYSGGVHLNPKANPPADAVPCKCAETNCKGYIF